MRVLVYERSHPDKPWEPSYDAEVVGRTEDAFQVRHVPKYALGFGTFSGLGVKVKWVPKAGELIKTEVIPSD